MLDGVITSWQQEWCCHSVGVSVSCDVRGDVAVCTVDELSPFAATLASMRQSVAQRLYQSDLIRAHSLRLRTYERSFVGTELVKWLLIERDCLGEVAALEFGRELMRHGIIRGVIDDWNFEDKPLLYRLTYTPYEHRPAKRGFLELKQSAGLAGWVAAGTSGVFCFSWTKKWCELHSDRIKFFSEKYHSGVAEGELILATTVDCVALVSVSAQLGYAENIQITASAQDCASLRCKNADELQHWFKAIRLQASGGAERNLSASSANPNEHAAAEEGTGAEEPDLPTDIDVSQGVAASRPSKLTKGGVCCAGRKKKISQ
eukprot:SAG11_NODE_29_length_23137_cov_16.739995_9_plen_317_part_00